MEHHNLRNQQIHQDLFLTTQNGKTAFTFNNNLLNSHTVDITYRSYMIVYKNISTETYSSPLQSYNCEYISHGGYANTLIYGYGNEGRPANTCVNHIQIGTPSATHDSIPISYVNNITVQSQPDPNLNIPLTEILF